MRRICRRERIRFEDATTVVMDRLFVLARFPGKSPILVSLEPDDSETKYYVPGIGAVLERDPGAGETFRLVSYFVP